MPDFAFYCAQDEYADFFAAVLRENNLKYVINDWYTYPTKDLEDDTSPEAIERILAAKRNVYLVGEFTVNGVAFSRETYGPTAGMYTVDETGMGPTMRFSFPKWFEEGLQRIASGDIQYHTKYCEMETETWYEASDELRAAYREIKKILQRRLKKVR